MSNAPSGNSVLLASATRNRAGVSCGASARARPISGSDMSTPSTWPPAPTRAARARPTRPRRSQHALTRRGLGGFYRGLAEHRQHGVEPSLVGDPALPALAIPVGDLIGILLCHAISLF